MGIAKVDRTETVAGRKPRKSKINYSETDGNLNSKLLAEDSLELARMAYKRLMRICNGKAVRGKDSDRKEFPLSAMSEARRKFYEDEFASLHEQAFAALALGRKVSAVSRNVPE
jgi:hypothetical protein